MSYRIEQEETLEDLEANVNSLVTNHGFKCRGGVFYDNKTNMYCQALEDQEAKNELSCRSLQRGKCGMEQRN